MSLEDRRQHRASEEPIVGGLPAAPGIIAAMSLSPGLATHLRGLADELLVRDYPGASIGRVERELLATAVSAANECFYCMDCHGVFATEVVPEARDSTAALVDDLKRGDTSRFPAKMRALISIARIVQRGGRELTRDDVARALRDGATDADTQLAVLIASAFCMYNRMVDGLRARTPPSVDAYRARAKEIAEHGYSDARVASIPK